MRGALGGSYAPACGWARPGSWHPARPCDPAGKRGLLRGWGAVGGCWFGDGCLMEWGGGGFGVAGAGGWGRGSPRSFRGGVVGVGGVSGQSFFWDQGS